MSSKAVPKNVMFSGFFYEGSRFVTISLRSLSPSGPVTSKKVNFAQTHKSDKDICLLGRTRQ